MPLGFSSERMPVMNMCDYCGESFQNAEKDPLLLACGHGYHKSCFVDFFHEKCRYCQSFLEHGIKQNVSSLVARITKHDTKEDNLVESREDKDQVTEDTETKESSDVILTQLEKDKSALYMVDEAYDIAIDKFVKV
jgi:hypothetical protein